MTVLNSYETYTNNGFIDIVVALLIVAVIFLMLGFLSAVIDGEFGNAVVLLVIGLAVAFGLVKAVDHATDQHTEYEVIIEDYNEVFEQGYEIVEQRGEITVVKKIEEANK